MASQPRTSKTLTISLPPDLAAKAEQLAKLESRTMSELFREAFRVYFDRHIQKVLDETVAYAATRNLQGYTEADVPRLIKEVRAEEAAEQAARTSKKAS
jgi:predicted transcriptional regulator